MITMILAYRNFPGVGKRFLSSLSLLRSRENNRGNHYNPINPGFGSDNNLGSGSEKANESTAIQLRQKNNHGNHYNPIHPGSDNRDYEQK